MRKFFIPLLMASAVMPATAFAQERGGLADAFRNRGAEAQQERSNDNPQRTERPARVERADRPQPAERAERRPQVDRSNEAARQQAIQVERRPQFDRSRDAARQRAAQVELQQTEPSRNAQIERVQRVRDGRPNDRSLVDGFRNVAQEEQRRRQAVANGADDPRVADVRRRVERRDDRDGRRWTGDWRRDHRYDWRSYRDRNRSIFRIGRYSDPYGWNYRRFSIGLSLYPNYYSSNYWLNDPWQYRLPPAYGPYRWVRYYDDALLVNIYTGQVVDAIHGFFWSTYGSNYGW
jgi:hypothetical protein